MRQQLLCGPILRRLTGTEVLVWLAFTKEVNLNIELRIGDKNYPTQPAFEWLQIGEYCHICLIRLTPSFDDMWPQEQTITYHLSYADDDTALDLSNLSFTRQDPSFCYRENMQSVVQGSCRKPDHPAKDAFTGLYQRLQDGQLARPDYLIMAGDQIYADDVSAPMLVAAQHLSNKLGLYRAEHHVDCLTKEQLRWQATLNKRHQLLPQKTEQTRWQKFWHGSNVISARFHENHLIGLDEFFATYLLTWSSSCWDLVIDEVKNAAGELQGREQSHYLADLNTVEQFIDELHKFEAVIANIPTLMIFDDHDVTDDWNLTADWESHIYGHPMTKHMIADGLLAYSIFQGWGNAPERIGPIIDKLRLLSVKKQFDNKALTELLLDFNRWDYVVDSAPKIVVLDTRTQRWRSETSPKNPSGLMDWRSLEQLEEEMFNTFGSILLVSPAPVFGVKAIEVVQSGCEIIGQELLVDVENWMAHQGSAKKLMSMMRDDDAPDEIIILSGDVHYSFCFSAKRRFSSSTDKIWQLTCSGFKNEFPQKLIKFFDYIDRFLYSQYSLLNIFTKRRHLAIDHHPLKCSGSRHKDLHGRHLVSRSAAGIVDLDEKGLLRQYRLVTGTGDIHEFALDE